MGSGCLSGLILRDAAYGRLLRMRSERVLILRSVALATRLEG